MKAGRLTYIQTITKNYDMFSELKISPNGRHIAITYTNYYSIRVVQKYSLIGNSYIISSQYWTLPERGNPNGLFVSNDGNLVATGVIRIDIINWNMSEVDLFSACSQTNCRTCWIGKCLSCKQGFFVVNGLCKCSRNLESIGSNC